MRRFVALWFRRQRQLLASSVIFLGLEVVALITARGVAITPGVARSEGLLILIVSVVFSFPLDRLLERHAKCKGQRDTEEC